jgi:hypothetical protein
MNGIKGACIGAVLGALLISILDIAWPAPTSQVIAPFIIWVWLGIGAGYLAGSIWEWLKESKEG